MTRSIHARDAAPLRAVLCVGLLAVAPPAAAAGCTRVAGAAPGACASTCQGACAVR